MTHPFEQQVQQRAAITGSLRAAEGALRSANVRFARACAESRGAETDDVIRAENALDLAERRVRRLKAAQRFTI